MKFNPFLEKPKKLEACVMTWKDLAQKPYDKNDVKSIVAAISASDLGLNPINEGNVVRLIIPALTEDRRRDIVKQAKKYGEETKIAIRNIRRAWRPAPHCAQPKRSPFPSSIPAPDRRARQWRGKVPRNRPSTHSPQAIFPAARTSAPSAPPRTFPK